MSSHLPSSGSEMPKFEERALGIKVSNSLDQEMGRLLSWGGYSAQNGAKPSTEIG
jgi:hypothetical protein